MKTLAEHETHARGEWAKETERIGFAIAEREGISADELLPYMLRGNSFTCKFRFPECCQIEIWPRHLKWRGQKLIGDYSWYVWTWPPGDFVKADSLGQALMIAKNAWARMNDEQRADHRSSCSWQEH